MYGGTDETHGFGDHLALENPVAGIHHRRGGGADMLVEGQYQFRRQGQLADAVAEGLVPVQAICLVDRSAGAVAAGMADRRVPYEALFEPSDLGVTA